MTKLSGGPAETSGRSETAPAISTPGVAARRSSIAASVRRAAARVRLPAGGIGHAECQHVIRFDAQIDPLQLLIRPISSSAPTSRITLNASWLTTSTERAAHRAARGRRRARIRSKGVLHPRCRSRSAPARGRPEAPQDDQGARVERARRESIVIGLPHRQPLRIQRKQRLRAACSRARRRSTPPMTASSIASTTSCRTSRRRFAPSACRTANSRRRASPFEMSSAARLTQTISSTNSTAPPSSSSASRWSPTRSSCNGRLTAKCPLA